MPPPDLANMVIGTLVWAPEHVPALRGVRKQLIECDGDKVEVHEIDDRPGTRERCAYRCAEETGFRDRGVADPLGTKVLDEALGRGERTAPGVERLAFFVEAARSSGDVLAHDEYLWIAVQFIAQGPG